MEKKDYHYILSLNLLCKGVNLILNLRETNFSVMKIIFIRWIYFC
jgi:hypothetical protein